MLTIIRSYLLASMATATSITLNASPAQAQDPATPATARVEDVLSSTPPGTEGKPMVKRPCLECGALTPGSRCPTHQRRTTNPERTRRAIAVATHRATHGNWCPGWHTPPHPATDLTADHVTPVATGGAEAGPLQVLCRSCNSRKRDTK